MPQKEVLNLIVKLGNDVHKGIADTFDRLNKITALTLFCCAVLVFLRFYFDTPIVCYVPVAPTGQQFSQFLSKYCWVHGTIPLWRNEIFPQTEEAWDEYDKHRRITYYQWVPVVLTLQGVMFFLPYMFWRWLAQSRVGGDLQDLLRRASKTGLYPNSNSVDNIVDFLCCLVNARGSSFFHQNHVKAEKTSAKDFIPRFKVFTSSLTFAHLLAKTFAIIHCLLQLVLMYYYLGFSTGSSVSESSLALGTFRNPSEGLAYLPRFTFGLTMLFSLFGGYSWEDTLMFPRVAYCRVPAVRLVGVQNSYTAQCALPVNMFNEKLFVFLWFWVTLLIFIGSVNLCVWIYRAVCVERQQNAFARMLEAQKIGRGDEDEFMRRYVWGDVLWFLQILLANQGELYVSRVLKSLYNTLYSEFAVRDRGHGDADGQVPVLV